MSSHILLFLLLAILLLLILGLLALIATALWGATRLLKQASRLVPLLLHLVRMGATLLWQSVQPMFTLLGSFLLGKTSFKPRLANAIIILLLALLLLALVLPSQPEFNTLASAPAPSRYIDCFLIDPIGANQIDNQIDFNLRFSLDDLTDGDNSVDQAIEHLQADLNLNPEGDRYIAVQNDLGCAYLKHAFRQPTLTTKSSLIPVFTSIAATYLASPACQPNLADLTASQQAFAAAGNAATNIGDQRYTDLISKNQNQEASLALFSKSIATANPNPVSPPNTQLIALNLASNNSSACNSGLSVINPIPKEVEQIKYALAVPGSLFAYFSSRGVLEAAFNLYTKGSRTTDYKASGFFRLSAQPASSLSLDEPSEGVYCYKLQPSFVTRVGVTPRFPNFGPFYVKNDRTLVLDYNRQDGFLIVSKPRTFLIAGRWAEDLGQREEVIIQTNRTSSPYQFTLDSKHSLAGIEIPIPAGDSLDYALEVKTFDSAGQEHDWGEQNTLNASDGIWYNVAISPPSVRLEHDNICAN